LAGPVSATLVSSDFSHPNERKEIIIGKISSSANDRFMQTS